MVELEETIEAQRVAAGIPLVRPAMDTGIVEIAPLVEAEDMGDAFIESLWTVLRDRRCYPLLDEQIAGLVSASIREGLFDPGTAGRARATQAGAASHFLARLPTFPRAGMDEILDVRDELGRPLRKFRSQMVKISRDLGVDAYSGEFEEAAEQAWIEHVAPALDELDDLVREMRLPAQFGAALPGSGAISAVGGLVTGILAGDVGVGAATGVAATGASGLAVAAVQRARLAQGLRNHPYYFLHRTEQLLAPN
jgi:hypothetical protein